MGREEKEVGDNDCQNDADNQRNEYFHRILLLGLSSTVYVKANILNYPNKVKPNYIHERGKIHV
jgi:hypothetical protein